MFKQLLSNNRIFGALVCVIVFAAGGLLYLNAVKRQAARDIQRTERIVKQLQTPKTEAPPQNPIVSETEHGHTHADGTFHAAPQEPVSAPQTVPAVVSPVPSVPRGTPFENFTPDPTQAPVEAAQRRLEYIKNNLHEWGDFWPRTLELIDEMTPMPEPPKVEGDGDDTVELLKELSALRDPRSAEILIKYQMESGIMGRPVDDALVAMGPAAVPALVARLDDLSGDSALSIPLELLVSIVAEHRSALGGIVEHIIIPKLESIAGSTNTYRHYAAWAISELQR